MFLLTLLIIEMLYINPWNILYKSLYNRKLPYPGKFICLALLLTSTSREVFWFCLAFSYWYSLMYTRTQFLKLILNVIWMSFQQIIVVRALIGWTGRDTNVYINIVINKISKRKVSCDLSPLYQNFLCYFNFILNLTRIKV